MPGLVFDDLAEVEIADEHENRDHREAHRDLI